MLKLKQYFCWHEYKFVASHISSSQNLWKCDRCEVYYIQHWGLGIGYRSKTPSIEGWRYEE